MVVSLVDYYLCVDRFKGFSDQYSSLQDFPGWSGDKEEATNHPTNGATLSCAQVRLFRVIQSQSKLRGDHDPR
jgi:hypothetical protein